MKTELERVAEVLNMTAEWQPTTRWLQDLRDKLTPVAWEMLCVLRDETLP